MCVEVLLREEQRSAPEVLAAKAECLACPPLVDLICKTLRGLGRRPLGIRA